MPEQNTKPNKLIALAYVIVQATILIILIFANMTFDLSIKKFVSIGSVLEWVGILGIFISAYSIRTSLTAMPLPKEQGKLATNGLYKFVRHPMYTSVLVFSLGLAINSGQVYKYLLVIGLYVLFYYKSRYEEIYLGRKYTGYKEYSKTTPRFIPFTKS
jgi:protein-S-isoprenylcysteine O-methyltransferase Ste14